MRARNNYHDKPCWENVRLKVPWCWPTSEDQRASEGARAWQHPGEASASCRRRGCVPPPPPPAAAEAEAAAAEATAAVEAAPATPAGHHPPPPLPPRPPYRHRQAPANEAEIRHCMPSEIE